jgi:oxygen-independent coproporphyrinogen-3 oxidase
MRYWRNEEYLGFGVSAASFVAGARRTNVADWGLYEARASAGLSCVDEEERLEGVRAAGEAVMLALRTRDGADLEELSGAHQTDLYREFAPAIGRMKQYGLLEEQDGRLRLTRPGMLVANRVLCEFV